MVLAAELGATTRIARRDPAGRATGPRSSIAARAIDYLLVEYGPMVLDLELRFRVHALMLRLQERGDRRASST